LADAAIAASRVGS